MLVGAWFHDDDSAPLAGPIALATACGIRSARSYDIAYCEQAAPALRSVEMRLFAGLWVDAAALAADWRSQVRYDELERLYALDLPIEAICVGNELREGGDRPEQKRFTARLSFGLANLLATYRDWLARNGLATPLTYAMEPIVFDREGWFHEWLWPLIDACDVVSANLYPMDEAAWFGLDAFAESRRFLHERRARADRLALFELRLRRILQQLEPMDKPLILSETGVPSAAGYRVAEGGAPVPETDGACFGAALRELLGLIRRIDADYAGRIRGIYLYEWRDNLRHRKIANVEQSPIHAAFGLCDSLGAPKFAIEELIDR